MDLSFRDANFEPATRLAAQPRCVGALSKNTETALLGLNVF